jgi:DNA-binding PadR family transcriptional regulator
MRDHQLIQRLHIDATRLAVTESEITPTLKVETSQELIVISVEDQISAGGLETVFSVSESVQYALKYVRDGVHDGPRAGVRTRRLGEPRRLGVESV